MACTGKNNTGSCTHKQCPHPDVSGFECVDIYGGVCEVGEGCFAKCPFAFQKGDKKADARFMSALKARHPEGF